MRALEFALATVIPDSSMAEQPAVNRQVLGSNPSQGAFYSVNSQTLPLLCIL